MILTGPAIRECLENGRIQIMPYDPECLNPNSYDVHMGHYVLTYVLTPPRKKSWLVRFLRWLVRPVWAPAPPCLDVRVINLTDWREIPEVGLVLRPGILYLGFTKERVHTDHYAAVLEGKSSLGRLGLSVHSTAGFIDCGFDGNITLEMTVVHPLRIYRGMRIGQICFSELVGTRELYKGKYQHADGVQGSRSFKDFTGE